MKDKTIAKKYLITSLLLIAVFTLITFIILFAIVKTGNSSIYLQNGEILLLSLACAYVPTGAYTGFCICLLPIKQLTKSIKFCIVFLFPLVLLGIIIIGNIMLIPTIIKSIITIKNT
jgi:hypothetical protein